MKDGKQYAIYERRRQRPQGRCLAIENKSAERYFLDDPCAGRKQENYWIPNQGSILSPRYDSHGMQKHQCAACHGQTGMPRKRRSEHLLYRNMPSVRLEVEQDWSQPNQRLHTYCNQNRNPPSTSDLRLNE